MSVQIVNKKVYRCHCEWPDCGRRWDAETTDKSGKAIDPPARCSGCKRYSWNRRDSRTADGNANNVPEPKTRQKRAVKMPKPRKVRAYEE